MLPSFSEIKYNFSKYRYYLILNNHNINDFELKLYNLYEIKISIKMLKILNQKNIMRLRLFN